MVREDGDDVPEDAVLSAPEGKGKTKRGRGARGQVGKRQHAHAVLPQKFVIYDVDVYTSDGTFVQHIDKLEDVEADFEDHFLDDLRTSYILTSTAGTFRYQREDDNRWYIDADDEDGKFDLTFDDEFDDIAPRMYKSRRDQQETVVERRNPGLEQTRLEIADLRETLRSVTRAQNELRLQVSKVLDSLHRVESLATSEPAVLPELPVPSIPSKPTRPPPIRPDEKGKKA